MSGKYDHLFVTNFKECASDMVYEGDVAGQRLPPNLSEPLAAMRAADVASASTYITTSWVSQIDHEVEWVREHEHIYDEVLMFVGNDPNNQNDLGGEVYMTIEGEKHVFTTTTSVFIPAGTKHCPLGFHKVDRPFLFFAVALSGTGNYMP
ncbi:hypothetical protein Skr01_48010 [Sphaerisporangium krabiense]|uniref:Mannose-6-phosphate isomerase-like protein (Cupin superfamily) n=1 Tax=Sphaerisporangium krabiense TaxID=763782 RepID=A0A7W9DP15_9ACTN|nr:hypothetical protein [Sphaerisporangium krabiense]MBB5625913.1 mannose-6-phosphate isomerase-like protein (cupin superfamily) [Sphaerisporangium krabiense]GII64716.1 hypothetical protein Skr01_48010 [Sphaerisporangium krabiense]